MGMIISHYIKRRNLKVLVLGLDAAGKTTLLYRLKDGRVTSTIPTIGYNVEEIKTKNMDFIIWDIGGQDKVQTMWKHFYRNVHIFIFVVDASDRERITEARLALENILMDPNMMDCGVLIFANKQDIEEAMRPREVAQKLGLTESTRKNWKIQPSCAITGDGLYEGLQWITRTDKVIRRKMKQKNKLSKIEFLSVFRSSRR